MIDATKYYRKDSGYHDGNSGGAGGDGKNLEIGKKPKK